MARRLGGWARLGIVLTLLWIVVVVLELWAEYKSGPFGLELLTDTLPLSSTSAAKTEDRSALPLAEKPFDPDEFLKNTQGFVPVVQAINMRKFFFALFGPIISMWILGFAWAWVREGFRAPKV